MTVPSATSRTNEAAERLLDLLESDSARPFLRSVMETNIDDVRAEERRLTVERITAVLEPTEPTLDEIARYGLDGGPGTNFNYLQWRLDRIRAILDEIGGAR